MMHQTEFAFVSLRRVCLGPDAPERKHLYVKEVEHRLKSPGRPFLAVIRDRTHDLQGLHPRLCACLKGKITWHTEPQQIIHNSSLSKHSGWRRTWSSGVGGLIWASGPFQVLQWFHRKQTGPTSTCRWSPGREGWRPWMSTMGSCWVPWVWNRNRDWCQLPSRICSEKQANI